MDGNAQQRDIPQRQRNAEPGTVADGRKVDRGQFRLIQGGVDHIQHYAVVRFFFSVPADNADAERVILHWLQQQRAEVELVGYVTSHA